MLESYGPECSETAEFVRMCNRMFDCLNGQFVRQEITTRNKDLAPYKCTEDERFKVRLGLYFTIPSKDQVTNHVFQII